MKALVVYYSASGCTKDVAQNIADALNADVFELVPSVPYTAKDLDYMDKSSRVCREHEDEKLRDIKLVAGTVKAWSSYDMVFIGYPIWWAIAAWPLNAFVKGNDFSGKTVVPFCTSGGSGLGRSGELLAVMSGTGKWVKGKAFPSSGGKRRVLRWLQELGL